MRQELTPNQRRFVRGYVSTGRQTDAAVNALGTTNRGSAAVYAHRTLSSVKIRRFVQSLLDAEGLSDRRLSQLLATVLSGVTSKNLRERALGLKALDMAMRMRGMYAPERVVVDHTFEGRTPAELEHYAIHGRWPDADPSLPPDGDAPA